MTYEPIQSGLSRRDVLKSAVLLGAVGTVGLSTTTRPAAALSHAVETLYLVENDGGNDPVLYAVELVDGTPNKANLDQLATFPADELAAVHIAATPDGSSIYAVDRESGAIGRYDTVNHVYDGVVGTIDSHPGGVVLASFSPDGELWIASGTTDSLYTVSDFDTATPTAVLVGDTGIDLVGADMAFTADGTLYVYTNATESLYTADTATGEATLVGKTGANFTGLAVRDAGLGDLVGSTTSEDDIVVFDREDGSIVERYDMYLDGERHPYVYGDMTVGSLAHLPECAECTDDGLLAKYEFACVEMDPVDDEEACVAFDFVFEAGDDSLVTYDAGGFESKEGEDWEPVSATFGTEYCTVWAVVKAGQELDVQELTGADGTVTASAVGAHAISFVAFFCTEAAARQFADTFSSKRRGNDRNPVGN